MMRNLQLPRGVSCQDTIAQLKEEMREIQWATFSVHLPQVNHASVGVRLGRRKMHTTRQLHRCMTHVLSPACTFTDFSGAAERIMGLIEDPEVQRRKVRYVHRGRCN
jgi:hypothetical protein